MFCTKCGNEMPDGSKFCTKCGAAFGGAATPEAPTAAGSASGESFKLRGAKMQEATRTIGAEIDIHGRHAAEGHLQQLRAPGPKAHIKSFGSGAYECYRIRDMGYTDG